MLKNLSVYEKEGIIFVVQIDHLSGELIGWTVDKLYEAGAHNVQIISSITKKNRPGYIFIVDVVPEKAHELEEFFVVELGSTGWHLIRSSHRHVPTEKITKKITFIFGEQKVQHIIEAKQIKGKPETIRPENRSCVAVFEKFKDKGVGSVSLQRIYSQLTDYLKCSDKKEITITFNNEVIKPLYKVLI